MGRFVLGVDGGNTKTVALVATTDSRIVGAGRAGPSDTYGAPTEAGAVAELRAAVDDAMRSAGVAEAGDPVARTIVAEQVTRLGAYARAAAARVALPAPFRMCLMGGVFRHASRLFGDAVVSGVPGAVRVPSTLEPACGAIILALHQLELGADRHELLATLPASALFVT